MSNLGLDQLLDLSEHELRSVRGWLNAMYSGWDIYITRPPAGFSRPALRIVETTPRTVEDTGRAMQQTSANWQIEILMGDEANPNSDAFWEVKRECAAVTNRMLRARLIPLYLYGWRYLRPGVEEVASAGLIPAGTVSVLVSAVNVEGEESLASEAAEVTVGANAAVTVLIPPWPRTAKVAEEYRVYAGAPGSETFQVSVMPDDGPLPSLVTLASIAAGVDPPDSSRFFLGRFLRVSDVESEILEHPQTDGVFNGYIRFRSTVTVVRDPHAWAKPVTEFNQRVEAS